MQIASCFLTVHVAHVLHDMNAEHVEVEVRVARHEGIEGPIDHAGSRTRDGLTLKLLETPANTEVLSFGAHGKHIGPMHRAAVLDTGQSEHKTDETPFLRERTG